MIKEKDFKRKVNGRISIVIIISIIISYLLPVITSYGAEAYAIDEDSTQETLNLLASEDISPGVHYTEEDIVNYRNEDGHRVRINHLVVNPKDPNTKIISAKAQDTVNAMETIGDQARREILKGHNVVAGINAASYDMEYGLNKGIQVKDGYIYTSQPTNSSTTVTPAFYVDEDGTPNIGALRVAGDINIVKNQIYSATATPSGIAATPSGISAKINSLNDNYYSEVLIVNRNDFGGVPNYFTRIYTSNITKNHKMTHGAGTVPNEHAYALIQLEKLDGYLKVGTIYKGKVLNIYENEGFSIPSDCIVYAGYSDRAAEISSLVPGSDVTYECHLYTGGYVEEGGVVTNRGEKNDSIVTAINSFHSLIRDGKIQEDVVNNEGTDNNSRTAIGLTEDNKIHVLAVAKPSTYFSESEGTSFKDLADYMLNELGCVQALNLDGGGSTEMIACRAGSNEVLTVSYPSDGTSRNVTNSLLFLNQAPRSSSVGQVVVDSSIKIFEGSHSQFSVRLADINGNAMSADGKQVTWKCQYGIIDDNGYYTAPNEVISDTVTATVDGVSGVAQVDVVNADSIAEINLSPNGTIALHKSDVKQFEFIAYDSVKKRIVIDAALADWNLSDDTIGSLKNGLLTITSETGEAVLTTSFLGQSYKVNIIVGLDEQIIDDFETLPIEGYYVGSWIYGRVNQHGGKSDMIKFETKDMENNRVKNGNKSLRLTYDTSMWAWNESQQKRTTNGTLNIISRWDDSNDYAGNGVWGEDYRFKMEQSYTAKAMPKKFGVWVYSGDENNDSISDNYDCMLTTVFKAGCTGPNTGVNKSIKLTPNEHMDWIGWKYIEVEIPQDWPMPIVFNYAWASNINRSLSPINNYKTDILLDDLKYVYTDEVWDYNGPEFSNTMPKAGRISSDILNFSTTITDAMSQVDASTITVKVNNEPYTSFNYDETTGKLSFKLTGLIDAQTYRIVVQAKDTKGNISVPYIDNIYTVDKTPDVEKPVISQVTPRKNVPVQIPQPRITFNLVDEKSGVDADSIAVKLDNKTLPVYYDVDTGWGYALSKEKLTDGAVVLTIDANDKAGNVMDTYTDTWMVHPISQPKDMNNYKITVIPDTQGNAFSDYIYKRASEDDSDIVVHLGDIVDNATDEEFEAARNYVDSLGKPCFVLAGNHEGVNGNLDSFFDTFGSPTYHFQYGNTLIVVLASVYRQSLNETDSTQYHYLEEVLKENTLPNVYVFNHVITRDPYFTEHNMKESEAEQFEGIMSEYKGKHPNDNVNVIFGHLHTLCNWKVNGVNYIIGGNSANKSYVNWDQGNLLGSGVITLKDGKGQYSFIPLLTKVYIRNAALVGNTLNAAEGSEVQLDLYGDFREYPSNYMTQLNNHELVDISWLSSDEQVASVDDNGLVKVKGKGTTNITSASGGKTHTITLQTVNPEEADVTGIELSLPTNVKTSQTIVPTVKATDVYNTVFALNNNSVEFTFEKGLMGVNTDKSLIAISEGVEKVTAKYKGFTSSVSVDITKLSSSQNGSSKKTVSDAVKPEVNYNKGGDVYISNDGTVTIVPKDGYEIKDVLLNGKSIGKKTKLTDIKSSDKLQVVFEKLEQVDIRTNKFEDINGNWAEDAINYVTKKGYFKGKSETTFAPNDSMNRAMFVTVLYRLEGEPDSSLPSFNDVDSKAYYAHPVAWATKYGIVNGVSDSNYYPDGSITREQIAAILVRYLEFKGIDLYNYEQPIDFTDENQISDYAKEAVSKLIHSGILKGKDNNRFDPKGAATRAEICTILVRIKDAYGLDI